MWCSVRLLCVLLPCVSTIKPHWYQKQIQRQLYDATDYPLYDSSLRPPPNVSGNAVLVEVDAVMISVGPVSSMDMTWTASLYFRQEWTDSRLVLNATDTESLARLGNDGVSRLWVPDVYFSNSKEDRKHDITVPNQLIYVNISTGRVLYSQRLTVVLNCAMDLKKFPHDTQNCEMKIESYSYKIEDLILRWSSSRSATNLLPTAFIPDFTIVDMSVLDCTSTYATGTYPCLTAQVTLKREIGYYITQSYIPTILIVILSWAAFWIDHEAVPARISVGLLTVLTITTQLSGSRAQLPRVPYIKAIDVWMSTNLVFVFAAYMEYAVVTVLSRRYKKTISGRRPKTSSSAKMREFGDIPVPQQDEAENGNSHSPSCPPVPQSQNGPAPCTGSSMAQAAAVKPPAVSASSAHALPRPSVVSPGVDINDTGRRVDKSSRVFFPVIFVVFNVLYWVYYLALA